MTSLSATRVICRGTVLGAATAVFFAGAALAAGSHSGGHGHHKGEHHGAAIGEPGKESEVTRTITVTLLDNYYEPENIGIKADETVRLVLKNDGEFVHEFNIGTPEMHAAHQDEMAMMVEHGVLEPDKINHERMKMDMGDGHMMDHSDPNSVLLEPGESGEIIWKFAEPMVLEFACNIPGHYDSGMAGLFRFTKEFAAN